MSYVTHTIIDRSGERSFTRHHLPTVTNANYAAVTGNNIGQNVGDLRLSLAAITMGNFVKHEVTAHTKLTGIVQPGDENAQRETKLLILCLASNGKRFSIEIPGANRTLLGQPNTDEVDVTITEVDDLISWLETNGRSPWDTAFTVSGARLVGRNL